MDKPTRNLIQKATQDARHIIEQEYAEQLEGTYDILLDGSIISEPGAHLDAVQRLIREKIISAIEHERAKGGVSPDSVATYLREAAFTTLNRFVALKMLEARGLVQECITKGEQSNGFKEFTGLASGLASLPDHGYRLYIESLFDEIGREVGILFDRRDSASLLWPRRQALSDLLSILNEPELSTIWGVDETIGWVYQYFNSQEERKAMREASQAPRNSRELAVRNQFFTPRYVVEFLTDNTLGRIWYEMRKGNTAISDRCRYLVRRPDEIFLGPGEKSPGNDEADSDLTREELLKRPVYIEHRPKKDPRDICVLDPACGSGHFLLYAFDLLEAIYLEAWEDLFSSPESKSTGKCLHEDFPDVDELHRELPRLILEHNLHGIDIDQRAVQIAALALWMRAQRSWREIELKPSERPLIVKTNIVCAEPMPGEKDMLEDFLQDLPSDALRRIAHTVFDTMALAGEAGSLLKIEDDIKESIREIARERGPLFRELDERRWSSMEMELLAALEKYSHKLEGVPRFQRRLFMSDAARGFGFIDLCRNRYDVVLMNPPFGDAGLPSKPYIEETYGDTKGDVYKAFVECFQDRLTPAGFLGIISSRAGFFLSQSTDWRERLILRLYRPMLLADLGQGVLDAMVETAAYVLRNLTEEEERDLTLSILPHLLDVPTDRSGYFSIPKYQAHRGGLRRHQAERELSRLLESGYATEMHGHFRRFTATFLAERDSLSAVRETFPQLYCFRLVEELDKGGRLLEMARSLGETGSYLVNPASFRMVPNTPFAYWVSDRVRQAFVDHPLFEADGRTAKQGLATADDFRFLRLWWEVPNRSLQETWLPFAKGGEYSPYYADVHLVVNWAGDGAEVRNFADPKSGKTYSRPQNMDFYLRPGLTWTRRTQKGLSLRIMSRGCVFGDKGPAVFVGDDSPILLLSLLGIMNSSIFRRFVELQMAFGSYEVGVVQRVPIPSCLSAGEKALADLVSHSWITKCELDSGNETSHAFTLPALLRVGGETLQQCCQAWVAQSREADRTLAEIQSEIDGIASTLYGIVGEEAGGSDSRVTEGITDISDAIAGNNGMAEDAEQEEYALGNNTACLTSDLFSWCLGVSFGRWDVRMAMVPSRVSVPSDPFAPLSEISLGMRSNLNEPSTGKHHEKAKMDGILVDDHGHSADLLWHIREVLQVVWTGDIELVTAEAADLFAISGGDLRQWFRRFFFDQHIKRYSKSRRKAPIYWQLATPTCSYAVWLYYHRFTKDTFYKVLNDYLNPKLHAEERRLMVLHQDAGPNPTAGQRKEISTQENSVEELRTFRDEVARIAPLWNPDLNDGVIINFAPLWRLVPQHRQWQKECKDCWDKLVKGDYDWAHLAMHLWPDRVVPKCATDRSLAIAHGLEETLWAEGKDGKWRPREVLPEELETLIRERTSPTVKAALNDLLTAPAQSSRSGGSLSTRRRRTSRS
ncbi:MAG: Eco57I restriction-modification methylase domain-containing protein [Syntrophobacteraceae bacterium]